MIQIPKYLKLKIAFIHSYSQFLLGSNYVSNYVQDMDREEFLVFWHYKDDVQVFGYILPSWVRRKYCQDQNMN